MQTIDVAWLRKAGVLGTEVELQKLADHAYDVLELRVGDKIALGLNDVQLEEAERLAKEGAISVEWIEKAYPSYRKTVAAEYAKFRRGILRSDDKARYILSQK